jgi:hypothetical protein
VRSQLQNVLTVVTLYEFIAQYNASLLKQFGKKQGPNGPSKKTQRSLTFQNVEHRLIFLFKLGKIWKSRRAATSISEQLLYFIIPDAAQGALRMLARIERCNEYR